MGNESVISRRETLAAVLATAAVSMAGNTVAAARDEERSPEEEKYLQTALKFWRAWNGEDVHPDTIADLFTDDCLIRYGNNGEIYGEGQVATKALFHAIHQSATYKVTVTKSFVVGRVVLTEFDFTSAQKGATPKQAPGHYAGVFIFKGDKIWSWTDVRSDKTGE